MEVLHEVTSHGTLRASYDVYLSDRDEEGKILFQLTDEGLIVDLFNSDDILIETFASTAEEFLHLMLGGRDG